MELKRIIARDSRAANDKAIQLYGPDVLVISSQRVDNQMELIVAVDVAPETTAAQPAQAAAVAPAAPAQDQADARQKARQEARQQVFSEVFKVSVENASAPEKTEEEWRPAALHLAQVAQAQPEAVLEVSAPQAEAQAPDHVQAPVSAPALPPAPVAVAPTPVEQDAVELLRSRDTVELLRQEIAALRQEFHLNRQVSMWQSGQGLNPELTQWFALMQELGVPASLRTMMVDACTDCDTVGDAWPLVQKTLTTAIQRRKSSWPQKGVHALVGPSGAGKSLMIARMAMAAAAKVSVDDMAIISLCDTKAGAWSQLQVLAAQSGVACYRAADMATLEVLLQELSHLKTVWIDTPGTDFLSHAQHLQASASAISVHAVLPLDATVTNVRKILDSSDVTWASLMLTKLDEAAHPWQVLKALCDRPLAVSAVGASHLARTEPQAFDAQAIVNLAMEGLRTQGMDAPVPVKKTRRRATTSRTKALNG